MIGSIAVTTGPTIKSAAVYLALLLLSYLIIVQRYDKTLGSAAGNAAPRQEQKNQIVAVDRNVDRLNYSAKPVRIHPRSASYRSRSRHENDYVTVAEWWQDEVRSAHLRRDFDEQFRSQSVDETWSKRTTRAIEQALDPASLVALGVPPPTVTAIACRTSVCRIELGYYPASIAVSDMRRSLSRALAGRVPYTHIFTRPRADQRVDYVIYVTR